MSIPPEPDPPGHVLILFDSVHFVLAAERLLRSRGVEVSVQPTPRALSSDCGVCLAVAGSGLEQARLVLDGSRLRIRGIHPVSREAGGCL